MVEPSVGRPVRELAQLADIGEIPPIRPWSEISLGPAELDLWCCFYAGLRAPDLLAAYDSLLTPDERARHQRFRFEEHRLQYLATRALCRWVLSRYAPVKPGEWRFSVGQHGKPAIATPSITPPLWFSLSNTRGLVVCAVCRTHEVIGVDVETIDRRTDPLGIAGHVFSPEEVHALRSLPAERHRERFFSYWTLKESYIKARGMGLALPLSSFTFHLDRGPRIAISTAPSLEDDPTHWQFALLRASPQHILAVGAKVGDEATLRVRLATCIPLRGPVSHALSSISDMTVHQP